MSHHNAFRIIVAKRPSHCRNCGGLIPKGMKKLIYQMDHPTYSSSCCRECFGELQFDEPKIVIRIIRPIPLLAVENALGSFISDDERG